MKALFAGVIGCLFVGTALANCKAGERAVWHEKTNYHSYGGTHQYFYKTLADCKSKCLAKSGCAAVDFDKTSHPCWFLTQKMLDGGIFHGSKVTHYTFECCKLEYKELKGTHHTAATYQAKHTTLAACKKACDGVSTCAGIEYNTDAKLKKHCWFLTKASLAKHEKSKTFNTYLLETKCKAPCKKFTWKESKGHHHLHGRSEPAKDVAACKKLCENESICHGIDFDTNKKHKHPCWLIPKSGIAKELKLKGVNSYVVTRKC